ncbi:MAG: hypothetical protein IPM82_16105 [Saprospiraceae bacterium]|nr:hypothetical protein [Saprospiraceae bacterium]
MKNGLVRFRPESFLPDSAAPKIVFTNFLLGNKHIAFGKDGVIPSPVPYISTLTLKHLQNDFAIEYAGLHYANPLSNQYTYRLEGVQEDWVYVGQERIARFADLSPGHYVFHVKAANGDGVWGEQSSSLEINILPPWWRTSWAYFLWGILASAACTPYTAFSFAENWNKPKLAASRNWTP